MGHETIYDLLTIVIGLQLIDIFITMLNRDYIAHQIFEAVNLIIESQSENNSKLNT